MGLFSACDIFGLITNKEKTMVMHQTSSNAPYTEHHTNVNGTHLQVSDTFTYLDRAHSCSTKIADEVAIQISKASQAFDRLQNIV
ncbi:DNA topoisomerase 2-beta [Sparganum proliferum]